MKKLDALIQLLDDPNEEIANQIKQEIIQIGDTAIPDLENVWEENSFAPNFRERVEDLIHTIQFSSVEQGLSSWVQHPENLLQGCYLLNKYQYPDLDIADLEKIVDHYANAIAEKLDNSCTPKIIVKRINEYLFQELGFRGNKKHFHAPQNNFLSDLFSSKKGNPLSLCILYILIAEKLNLPIVGVNLPSHFILAYKSTKPEGDSILFYINPFSKGTLLEYQDLVVFLKEINLKPKKIFTQPCSNVQIIRRMVVNLIFSYSRIGHSEKTEELRMLEEQLTLK